MRFLTLASALAFLVPLAAASAGAGAAERRETVASQAMFTRYGTSHEAVNVLSLESSLEVRIGVRWALSAVVPLSSSFMDNNACCGYSLGNLTGGARYRLKQEGMRVDLLASVSAPTAPSEGDGSINSRYAATAAVTRDAGFYLPGVSTVRLAVDTQLPIGARAWLGAHAGAHAWITHLEGQTSQIVLPAGLLTGYRLSPRIATFAAFTTIANPWQRQELLVHAVEVGVAHVGDQLTFGVRLHLPLDQSLRALGMVGVGANLQASF